MPDGKQTLDLRQPPPPDGLRLPTAVHQGSEVPFEVRPAEGSLRGGEPTIRRPAVRRDHARKVGPEQCFYNGRAPAALNPKDGQRGRYDRPQPGPLLLLPPARFVHVDDVRLLDCCLGLLHDGCEGGTLRLLLAHHRPQGHPDRPQVL